MNSFLTMKRGYSLKQANDTSAQTTEPSPPAELVWFGQAVLLKDFPESHSIPNIVKIVHGEYMNLACKDGSSQDDDGKENEILLYSVETVTKVLCVNLRVKDTRGVSQTENKLSIPLLYEGWFEVLSEDGRRVKPIESIKDLARIFPHTCLVRKTIQAFVPMSDGTMRTDWTRSVHVGETLILFGVLQLTMLQADGSNLTSTFLRCLDSNGSSVYFRLDQLGSFSPVAGKDNISGVHTIKGILNKFHLPVTCKLVHGSYPKNVDKSKFSGIMRIVYVYDENTVFVSPVNGKYRMMPIPAEVPLKVVPAINFNEVQLADTIKRLMDRCTNMVKYYYNSIHLLYDIDVVPPPKDVAAVNSPLTSITGPSDSAEPEHTSSDVKDPESDALYDEVEDIYFYVVRHGVAPPDVPKRMFKEGEQDNDFWEQPIYKTLHKQREMESVGETKNGEVNGKQTKVYRFYEGENISRPLAYIQTGIDDVDKAVDVNMAPSDGKHPGLVALRRYSECTAADKKAAKKAKQKSQPAIFRFFSRLKEDKSDKNKAKPGSAGSNDGSNGSNSESKKGNTANRRKLKNLYL